MYLVFKYIFKKYLVFKYILSMYLVFKYILSMYLVFKYILSMYLVFKYKKVFSAQLCSNSTVIFRSLTRAYLLFDSYVAFDKRKTIYIVGLVYSYLWANKLSTKYQHYPKSIIRNSQKNMHDTTLVISFVN